MSAQDLVQRSEGRCPGFGPFGVEAKIIRIQSFKVLRIMPEQTIELRYMYMYIQTVLHISSYIYVYLSPYIFEIYTRVANFLCLTNTTWS